MHASDGGAAVPPPSNVLGANAMLIDAGAVQSPTSRSQIRKPPASGNRRRPTTPCGAGSAPAKAHKPSASRRTPSAPLILRTRGDRPSGLVETLLSEDKQRRARKPSASRRTHSTSSHWKTDLVEMFMDEDERRIEQFRARLQHVLHDGIHDSAALVTGRHASITPRRTGIQVKVEYFRESFPQCTNEPS